MTPPPRSRSAERREKVARQETDPTVAAARARAPLQSPFMPTRLSTFGDAVALNLRRAFGLAETAAPSAPAAASSQTSASAHAPPSSSAQATWLHAAVTESVMTFGTHIDRRLSEVENRVAEAHSAATAATVGVAEARDAVEELQKTVAYASDVGDKAAVAVDVLTARVVALEISAKGRSSASAASTGVEAESSAGTGVPYELRQAAIIAGHGWDDFADTLRSRAASVLSDAGVPTTHFRHICPLTSRSGGGSSAEVWFTSGATLQEARLAVRALRRSYQSGRCVWLDSERDRSEVAPIRAVRRLQEHLAEIQKSKAPLMGGELRKDDGARAVCLEGGKFSFVSGGRVHWTSVGEAALSVKERAAAAACAEAV